MQTAGYNVFGMRVFAEALHDKKRTGDVIELVIPREVGGAALARTPLDEFRRILEVGLACTRQLLSPSIKED